MPFGAGVLLGVGLFFNPLTFLGAGGAFCGGGDFALEFDRRDREPSRLAVGMVTVTGARSESLAFLLSEKVRENSFRDHQKKILLLNIKTMLLTGADNFE